MTGRLHFSQVPTSLLPKRTIHTRLAETCSPNGREADGAGLLMRSHLLKREGDVECELLLGRPVGLPRGGDSLTERQGFER